MSKANHDHRPLFEPWLAWEQLPDSVRQQALDVLTSLYLETTEFPRIGEHVVKDASIVGADLSRSIDHSSMESQPDDARPH